MHIELIRFINNNYIEHKLNKVYNQRKAQYLNFNE